MVDGLVVGSRARPCHPQKRALPRGRYRPNLAVGGPPTPPEFCVSSSRSSFSAARSLSSGSAEPTFACQNAAAQRVEVLKGRVVGNCANTRMHLAFRPQLRGPRPPL